MQKKFLSIIMILSNFLLSFPSRGETIPFAGVEKLKLPKDLELSVVTEKDFDMVDEQGTRRYWKTTLSLAHKKKVVWGETHREFNELEWVYGNIIPIRKNQYYSDLNGDGYFEVAILAWDFGMATYRNVKLYTVKDNRLLSYGEGKFNFEQGPYVILGCPACSKYNLMACKVCY